MKQCIYGLLVFIRLHFLVSLVRFIMLQLRWLFVDVYVGSNLFAWRRVSLQTLWCYFCSSWSHATNGQEWTVGGVRMWFCSLGATCTTRLAYSC